MNRLLFFFLLLFSASTISACGEEDRSELIAANTGPTVLITGANRGVGLALARKFKQEGYRVIGTARSPTEAGDLAATGAVVLPLDVTDTASVEALAQQLNGAGIDVLVNNAGILGHRTRDFESLDVEQLMDTFNVNTLGPLRVVQALLPNLRASSGKTVVNISSGFGSTELAKENNGNCCFGYSASKAALNNLNMNLSKSFRQEELMFVVLHPGTVNTSIAGSERVGILPNGMISPDESAAGLFSVITSLTAADNGAFIDWQGNRLPW